MNAAKNAPPDSSPVIDFQVMVPAIQSTPQQCRWHGFATPSGLEQAADQFILDAASNAIARKGSFQIVLAGGGTPRNVYHLLSAAHANWAKWHVYFGDERCLPPEHPERNSQMARQAWLDHVPIPREQIHGIPAETGAESAAASYERTLSGIGIFDLVLLGLGEDGHTASLFPNHDWGLTAEAPAAIAVHGAPKPPPDRVSLSANRLSMAHQVLFLVAGNSKRPAIRIWRNGGNIPATAIAPQGGVDIYLEAALLGGQ
jgi:6-phosphogluconolactonase